MTDTDADNVDKLRTEGVVCDFDAEIDFRPLSQLVPSPLKFTRESAVSNRFSESDLNSTQALRIKILDGEMLFVLEPDQLGILLE